VEYRTILRDVDVLAREHRIDLLTQSCGVREVNQARDRVIPNQVLGVVQEQVATLDSEALCPLRISGKLLTQVGLVYNCLLGYKCRPRWGCGYVVRGHEVSLSSSLLSVAASATLSDEHSFESFASRL
jgi:hypothetical protein